jgi:hypothetical protein
MTTYKPLDLLSFLQVDQYDTEGKFYGIEHDLVINPLSIDAICCMLAKVEDTEKRCFPRQGSDPSLYPCVD